MIGPKLPNSEAYGLCEWFWLPLCTLLVSCKFQCVGLSNVQIALSSFPIVFLFSCVSCAGSLSLSLLPQPQILELYTGMPLNAWRSQAFKGNLLSMSTIAKTWTMTPIMAQPIKTTITPRIYRIVAHSFVVMIFNVRWIPSVRITPGMKRISANARRATCQKVMEVWVLSGKTSRWIGCHGNTPTNKKPNRTCVHHGETKSTKKDGCAEAAHTHLLGLAQGEGLHSCARCLNLCLEDR